MSNVKIVTCMGNKSSLVSAAWVACDINIHVNDVRHTLSPQEDLTAFELYNINKWVEEVKMRGLGFDNNNFYERAVELKIERHFVSG